MSAIEITRDHNLSHDEAVAAATALAETLAEKYDVAFHWEGEKLIFARSGVKGQLCIEPSMVHLKMELGLLMKAFSGRIERSIHSHLDNLVG